MFSFHILSTFIIWSLFFFSSGMIYAANPQTLRNAYQIESNGQTKSYHLNDYGKKMVKKMLGQYEKQIAQKWPDIIPLLITTTQDKLQRAQKTNSLWNMIIYTAVLYDLSQQNTSKWNDVRITEIDRENLEKLKEIIQSQVPEASRATFMSYFGKLRDGWYDQNQKIITIIEFEKVIVSGDLDGKLVSGMYNILEGFLITDDTLGVEVSIALNVVRGLIPVSSSYAEEVMGKDGKGGLLKEILSAPNNLEENKVKALKILVYVKDDAQIATDHKNILKSQLKIIVYRGSENIPD